MWKVLETDHLNVCWIFGGPGTFFLFLFSLLVFVQTPPEHEQHQENRMYPSHYAESPHPFPACEAVFVKEPELLKQDEKCFKCRPQQIMYGMLLFVKTSTPRS